VGKWNRKEERAENPR